MNVGEYGVVLQFGVSFSLINETSLMFLFERPDTTTFTRAATLGNVPVSTTFGTFAANQYATYTFVNGDINQTGAWSVRLIYQDNTPAQLISTPGTFVVQP